jgi:tetratricopeptide (TPR) repeat protein
VWDATFFRRLRERKLVQWTLAYLAGAFVVLQALDPIAEAWGLSPFLLQSVQVLLAVGFLITLVLAWYHGEKGRQRVTGPEVLALVSILAVTGIGIGMLYTRTAENGDAPGPVLEDDDGMPAVLVVPFENGTDDPDRDRVGEMAWHYVSTLLEDAALTSPGTLRLLGEGVGLADRSLSAGLTRAREVGAELVVWGSYYAVNDSLELVARVVDVPSGASVGSAGPLRVASTDPVPALGELAQRLVGTLVSERSPELGLARRYQAIGAGSYPSYAAYQSYVDGRRAWNQGDVWGAGEFFAEAFARDTTFVVAAIDEAFARAGLFENGRADSILRVVQARRDELLPIHVWYLDFTRAITDMRAQEVHRLVREKQARTPDRYWTLMRGFTALDARRPREALGLFQAHLSGPDDDRWQLGNNAQVWRKYAEVLHSLGRHEDALDVVRQGLDRFPDRAEVLGAEIFALAMLGRAEEIEARLPHYRAVSDSVPWSNPLQDWAVSVGMCRYHGHDECVRRLMRGLQAYLDERSPAEQRELRGRWAHALISAGRLEEAEAVYRQVAEESLVDVREPLAWLEAWRGETEAAEALDAEIRDAEATIDSYRRLTPAYRLFHRSGLAAWSGNRERALFLLREAYAEGLAWYPYSRPYYPAHMPLWGDPEFEELLKPIG